jgi:hypothetical protein
MKNDRIKSDRIKTDRIKSITDPSKVGPSPRLTPHYLNLPTFS